MEKALYEDAWRIAANDLKPTSGGRHVCFPLRLHSRTGHKVCFNYHSFILVLSICSYVQNAKCAGKVQRPERLRSKYLIKLPERIAC